MYNVKASFVKNPAREYRIEGVVIKEIEDAVDSANLLSLDLAIHAFETCADARTEFSGNAEAFRCAAQSGLKAASIIGRMMDDMRIS